MVRPASIEDASAIADIYNYYILNSIATFTEVEETPHQFEARIASPYLDIPWLVFEENQTVIGYAYAGQWHSRSAYRFTIETSVYLDHRCLKKGVGSALYTELFTLIEATECHSVIAGVSLPNAGSIALHEKFGFEKVCHYKEVGYKLDKWVDVGYWQKMLK